MHVKASKLHERLESSNVDADIDTVWIKATEVDKKRRVDVNSSGH